MRLTVRSLIASNINALHFIELVSRSTSVVQTIATPSSCIIAGVCVRWCALTSGRRFMTARADTGRVGKALLSSGVMN